jgi:hypothetical protein
MGVAQITRKCDRALFVRHCFIKHFQIGSVWRAGRRTSCRDTRFPHRRRSDEAESSRRNDRIFPGFSTSRCAQHHRFGGRKPARNLREAATGTARPEQSTDEGRCCRRQELRRRNSMATRGYRCRNRNRPAGNLPLAARSRVGHIGTTGDVAEWLKAAVC